MLGLLWNGDPQLVHVVGLGGGRLPMVLHHYFPSARIECTEIDGDVSVAARRYFGLHTDHRLRIILEEGRDYLARRSGSVRFDLIFVDGFRGVGFGPLRLATQEFLELCRAQRCERSVLAVNILPRDPLRAERVRTIARSFKSTYIFDDRVAVTVLATDGAPLDARELMRRARLLELERGFLSLVPLLSQLRSVLRTGPASARVEEYVLTDSNAMQPDLDEQIARQVRGKQEWPCGSGLKFGMCHGLRTAPGERLAKSL